MKKCKSHKFVWEKGDIKFIDTPATVNNDSDEIDDSIERFIMRPEDMQFITPEESKRRENEPGWTTIHISNSDK